MELIALGWFEDFLQGLWKGLTTTLRRFVALLMVLFFLGSLYGLLAVPKLALYFNTPEWVFLLLPLLLAVLAYFSTVIAAVLFVILLALILFIFI